MNLRMRGVMSIRMSCCPSAIGLYSNRARALAPWVLLVFVFGGHFLEAGVVRRLLEGWVSPPLEFNTYPFTFGTSFG